MEVKIWCPIPTNCLEAFTFQTTYGFILNSSSHLLLIPFVENMEPLNIAFALSIMFEFYGLNFSASLPSIFHFPWAWKVSLLGYSSVRNAIFDSCCLIIIKCIWKFRCLSALSHSFLPFELEFHSPCSFLLTQVTSLASSQWLECHKRWYHSAGRRNFFAAQGYNFLWSLSMQIISNSSNFLYQWCLLDIFWNNWCMKFLKVVSLA